MFVRAQFETGLFRFPSGEPAERSCAAGEAAPMAFSYRLLAVFSEIPEKPRVRSEPIPFLYPLAVSAER